MNSFLTNQLEDVKNDLKELDVITIRSLENEQDYQDGECSETFRDSEFDGYLKEKRGLNAKIKTKLQKYHEWASEIQSKLKNKEKHGVFILDAKVVDDEMIKRALNQTHEQEIELLKEDYEIKIKSARIDERNKVCQELINEFELSTFISEVEKLAKENGVELK